MAVKLITTKITEDALTMLRDISALTGEKQYAIINRLLAVEEFKVKAAHRSRLQREVMEHKPKKRKKEGEVK